MIIPHFKIKAFEFGWHFYDRNGFYIGVMYYHRPKGNYCLKYLEDNPHLK